MSDLPTLWAHVDGADESKLITYLGRVIAWNVNPHLANELETQRLAQGLLQKVFDTEGIDHVSAVAEARRFLHGLVDGPYIAKAHNAFAD